MVLSPVKLEHIWDPKPKAAFSNPWFSRSFSGFLTNLVPPFLGCKIRQPNPSQVPQTTHLEKLWLKFGTSESPAGFVEANPCGGGVFPVVSNAGASQKPH